MMLQLCQQIESLQAIDTEGLEKIVIRREFLARNLEMRGSEAEHLVQCVIHRGHVFYITKSQNWQPETLRYGRYGKASVLSTNFFNPDSTAGFVNKSQKISISCCSSS